MSLSAEDIDDISISESRVIVAIGARRYLFGNLERAFTDGLRRYQLEGRLTQSDEVRRLVEKIVADRTAEPSREPKRNVLALSSRTVTSVSRRLIPLTGLPLSAFICLASAVCLVLVFGDGLANRLREFPRKMDFISVVVAFVSYISSIFVHEFGHAVLCLKKTGMVGSISVRFNRGLPVFATDVSSLHLAARVDQAKIAIGGVLFQTCFASLLLMSPVLAMNVGGALALFAALFSLLPFPRSDGYWFMNDTLGLDLSRTYREASARKKMFHPYTIWLVAAHILICYLLLYWGFQSLSQSVEEGPLLLSGIALWALYIIYVVLVVSSHVVRAVRFLRNGTLGRWDRGTATG